MPEFYLDMLLIVLKKCQDANFYTKSNYYFPQKGEFIFV